MRRRWKGLNPRSMGLGAMTMLLLVTAACGGRGGEHSGGEPTGIVPPVVDNDYDGWTVADGDCADLDASVHPEAEEVCDGVDQDCDGVEDNGAKPTWYRDADQDGWGNTEVTQLSCAQPSGYVSSPGDCNDTSQFVHPGAPETCHPWGDEDCDGAIDEGLDQDGDGTSDCRDDDGDGQSEVDGDCDDQDPALSDRAPEVCDGLDQDCDGAADEGLTTSTWYVDQDGDGHGAEGSGVLACGQPPGYAAVAGDCDDQSPTSHPGAAEGCDALDNDCDGEVDETKASAFYEDADGDGFGDEGGLTVEACSPGFSPKRGDCDDDDPFVYPGAEETSGDGLDADCGGSDGADPHVGLTAASHLTIQAALDGAADGQTVWVGPGTWLENELTMSGKAVALRSTHGEAETVIDGEDLGSVFYFTDAEGPDSLLDGFTITNGRASYHCWTALCEESGGGIFIHSASPTLTRITLTGNSADSSGGGMYLSSSSPTLTQITLTGNSAAYGGGMYLSSSSPTLTRITLTGNSASSFGGGMYLSISASPTLSEVTLTGNSASSGGGMYLIGSASPTLTQVTLTYNSDTYGGAMYLYDSASPTLTQVTLTGNSASSGGGMYLRLSASPTLTQVTLTGNSADYGGGMFLSPSASPTMTQVTLTGNSAASNGGGMFLSDSASPTLSQVTLSDNSAGRGAGMYLSLSSPRLSQVTVVGNTAAELGGGLYLDRSSPILTGVILAYNTGAALYRGDSSSEPTVSGCDLYSPIGISHNLGILDTTNLEVDPEFVAFSNNGDPYDDDLHLRHVSPLIDAGPVDLDGDELTWAVDPDDQDPDGTHADVGAYGGPGADWSGYEDQDEDGLYDAWESTHGLDAGLDDSAEDPDGDGVSNVEELDAGTDPQVSDSDGDGYSDGAELNAGSDAQDGCARPGLDGYATLSVPEDYATIQAAVDAVKSSCRIEVAPGTWVGTVRIGGKGIELIGLGGEEETILDGNRQGTVISAVSAIVHIEGFTVTGGRGYRGGGLALTLVEGAIESVIVNRNSASWGGGMYLMSSSPSLSQLVLTGNSVSGSNAGDGGGMYLNVSSPSLSQITLSENSAPRGGGMYLASSLPSLSGVVLAGNSATSGGGLYLSSSSPELSQVTLRGNTASAGGGMFLDSSSPSLSLVDLIDNSASSVGGGMYLSSSSPILNRVTLEGNRASDNGGGMYLASSLPILSGVVLTGNSATSGGGLYLSSSSPSLTQVSVSENSASIGGGMFFLRSSPSLSLVDLNDNSASSVGGGMYLSSSSPILNRVTLEGNRASDNGGGMYLRDFSYPTLNQVILVGNSTPNEGGGMYLESSSVTATESIIAYNSGSYDIYQHDNQGGFPIFTWCDIYGSTFGITLGSTNLTVEPGFLEYGLDGRPVDVHLAADSLLVDAGNPDTEHDDPDGTRADLGIYAGPGAEGWDRDGDGYHDWFWPGTLDDAPDGYHPSDWDADDLDPEVH